MPDAIIQTEISELKEIRSTVMDLYGDLAVVKEGHARLEKEVKALRDSRHDHSNHIHRHQQEIRLNTKLIKWYGALVSTILTVGLAIIIWLLQPLLKSVGLI